MYNNDVDNYATTEDVEMIFEKLKKRRARERERDRERERERERVTGRQTETCERIDKYYET